MAKFFWEKTKFTALMVMMMMGYFYLNGAMGKINLPNGEKFPALIVFGDSIVDPGNNNYINTMIKCDFPPYGRDFRGAKPTGRFSNGLIPSDLIAQELGIKDLVPPYLDHNLKPEDLVTGVSFASGGSGYDPETPKSVSVLSLSDQLDMFKEYLSKIEAAFGEERKEEILSKSLYLVCIGSDDIANTYYILPFRRIHYDLNSYTDLLLNSASTFYQELYKRGARKIAVLGLPPLGCVPSQRTIAGGFLRNCSDKANEAAKLFNSKISSKIDSLNTQLPGVKLVYFDIYYPLLSLILNPAKYGFEVATKGCCGTGNIEVSILCNPGVEGHSCPDASKYIFWDSYHPSQQTYQTLVPITLNQGIYKLF
ncbi:GDSL esterase/lipase EXL3-like [Euphorbia lathyris]|uniref:GDSL esterase/lipase EXL3-like n=1 Tax=Euphorbia lathyris TaxID=212925 RepID=UPI003313EE6D